MCITNAKFSDFRGDSEKIERMEPVHIIGNSTLDYLEVEGTIKVCQGGAILHRLKPEIERGDGLKLIVAGIPDLFKKGSSVVVGPLIDIFEKELEVV